MNSISTEITEPSIITYWLRGEGLERPTRAVAGRATVVVTEWIQVRQVVLPGEYRILNDTLTGSTPTPLFVDEVDISPLTIVSLGEAAEAPGLVPATSFGVMGIADPLSAPDGQDAIYFSSDASAILPITATGPACLICRYAPTAAASGAQPVRAGTSTQWVSNGRLFAGIPPGATMVELGLNDSFSDDGQTRVDQIQVLPATTAAEALDAPALAFQVMASGDQFPNWPSAFPSAPDGAEGDDAMLMDARQKGSGFVSSSVTGRGTLRFRSLGSLLLNVDGKPFQISDTHLEPWRMTWISLGDGPHTLQWSAGTNSEGCLDAVAFEPDPSALASTVLGQPGIHVSFSDTANLVSTQDPPTEAAKLQVRWLAPVSPDAAMEVAVTGPCVFSLAAADTSFPETNRMIALGSGPDCGWLGRLGTGDPQTAFLIPTAGAQTVRVRRGGTFDQLGVIPLEELPLAEGTDAPALVFRTSPATPWRGVRTPSLMAFDGDDAVCGGEHTTSADPWIEADVTGPGVLRFRLELTAKTAGSNDERDSVSLDGGLLPLPETAGPRRQRLVHIPPGTHTIRWTQQGSRALSLEGSVLWLDAVSVEPSTPVSINEALETGNRSWTIGNTGPVTPLATSTAPDGTDAVYFPSDAGFIATTIRLPCEIQASGTGFFLESDAGQISTTGSTPNRWFIDGNSTTTLRIRRLRGVPLSVVSDVRLFEFSSLGSIEEVMGIPGVSWQTGGFSSWSYLRDAVSGAARLLIRNPPQTKSIFLEAAIPAPFRLGPVASQAPAITLPTVSGNLLASPVYVGGGDVRRVRLRFGTTVTQVHPILIIDSAGWQPAHPAGAVSGGPGWTWSTGGDLGWLDHSSAPDGLIGGPVGTGQVSWLEGELTIPTASIVSWKLGSAHASFTTTPLFHVSVNSVPLPLSASTWLHAPAGTHRIRWQVEGASTANNLVHSLRLSDLRVTPKPTGSVQAILGAPNLFFVQRGPHALPPSSGVLDWPQSSPWIPVTDTAAGRTALQTFGASSGDPNPLWVLRPGPGTINAFLRADQFAEVFDPNPVFPVASIPFPWTHLRTQPVHTGSQPWFLMLDGGRANFWIDDVSFTPAPPVGIGEALDRDGLSWQTGGSRSGLIGGWAGATPGSDSVVCQGLLPGEFAWIEAPVTGSAVLTWKRTDALRLDVLINGQRAQRFTGRPGAPTNVPLTDTLTVGNGTSTVRWQFSRESGIGDPTAALDALSITAGPPSPDIASLVDQPGLEWTLTPAQSRASTSFTHDGVDALEIVPIPVEPPNLQPEYTLATEIVGPGVFRCWFRGALAYLRAKGDDAQVLASAATASAWKEFITPVPPGIFRFSLVGQGAAWLDDVSWTPLPSLSLTEALDVPEGTVLTPAPGAVLGAAAWGAFAADSQDSVIMLPGTAHRLTVPAAAGSTLTLRARAHSTETSLAVGAAEQRTSLVTTTWSKVEFTVASPFDAEGVVIRASSSGGPVLLDQLTVRPPATTPYQSWLVATGLAGHPLAGPDQDADGDLLTNLLELAFGLNPLQSSHSDFESGMPTVRLLPRSNLSAVVIIEFLAVPGVRYEIETAPAESPTRWSRAHVLSVGSPGLRSWEVPDANPPISELLFRVRVSLL
ncbi:MAG: hypothetical protein ACKV19_24720 [Verrucomicrobiales bacterium]